MIARKSYHQLFDTNFGYRLLTKLRNIMHHDTMNVLDIAIRAVAYGDTRESVADIRVVRKPFLENSHCNRTLKTELNGLSEEPMAIELMLQTLVGLRMVTRHLRKLIDPHVEEHCEAIRNFEELFEGKRGQRMLGDGTIRRVDGHARLPRYWTVDPEILEFAHGRVRSIPSFEYTTIPDFDAASFANQLP